MKQVLVGIVLLGALCGTVTQARAQSWAVTNGPGVGPMVCSADGSTQLGVLGFRWECTGCGGPIYVSHDSGSTWTTNDLPTGAWAAAASSADGRVLMTLDAYGDLYTSTNSGGAWTLSGLTNLSTWTNEVTVDEWPLGGIACSADGSRMYAAALGTNSGSTGSIYTSTNFGGTWAPTAAAPAAWWPLTCSADGSTLIAGETSNVWISTDAGADFRLAATLVPPSLVAGDSAVCSCLACSADGTKIIAGIADAEGPCGVATSVDSGAAWVWSPEDVSSVQVWSTVCCSADGVTMAATGAQFGGALGEYPFSDVLLSSDSGATWAWQPGRFPNAGWTCTGIAMTADGSALFSQYLSFGEAPHVLAGSLTTPPAPLLVIEPSAGGVGLSWVVPAAPFTFTVQQNADLSTTNWTTVPGNPVLDYSTLRDRLTIQPPAGPMFYRLISQ